MHKTYQVILVILRCLFWHSFMGKKTDYLKKKSNNISTVISCTISVASLNKRQGVKSVESILKFAVSFFIFRWSHLLSIPLLRTRKHFCKLSYKDFYEVLRFYYNFMGWLYNVKNSEVLFPPRHHANQFEKFIWSDLHVASHLA